MEYEDGYDDGYDDGVKAMKNLMRTWTGWPGLSETAFALTSQLGDVDGMAGYAAKIASGNSPALSFDAGQSLVALGNGEDPIDLNSLAWSGVAPAGSNRLTTSAADYIQFRNPEDDYQIRYFWVENGGWGLPPVQARKHPELVADGKAIVPAGVVFWYYRNPAAEGSASMAASLGE